MDKNNIKLLDTISHYVENRVVKKITTNQLVTFFRIRIKALPDSELIKFTKSIKLNQQERIFYFYVIWKSLNFEDQCDYVEFASYFFDDSFARISFLQEFSKESNRLFSENLIENIPNKHGLTFVTLTDKSREHLHGLGYHLTNTRKQSNELFTIIDPLSIKEKSLFYNESVVAEIDRLNQIINPVNLNKLQKQFKSNSFNEGITILLYGSPGTGKTETAFQLAKHHSKSIILVNVSELRSRFHGESERLVKRLFIEYNTLQSKSKNTPILLLNEADSMLSSRQSGNLSSTDMCENTILNIILTELETFKGIMIATTNLNLNIDKALERRFLYKIELQSPSKNTQLKLWKTSFPKLNPNDYISLVSEFNLTGAQINNILKKTVADYVINKQVVNYQYIRQYCLHESIGLSNHQKKQVGYTNTNKNLKFLDYENSTSAS